MVRVMARRDARSLDHATLEEMRRLAVKRVVEGGDAQVAVARSLEVHPVTVAKWVGTYRRRGEAGLARRIGPGSAAAAHAEATGAAAPVDHRSHAAAVPLPVRAVERPVRRAFTRDDEACRRWAETEFPAVVRQMQRRQSTLLFEDETGVHEDGPVARTWGARGQTPIVRVTGQRDRVNLLSAISPRGRLWFRCYRGTLNAPRFIGFLTALLHDVRGEIDLVLDRHPAHVAAATRRCPGEIPYPAHR
jgi:hypothetical protein